jgi:hypothetical protein
VGTGLLSDPGPLHPTNLDKERKLPPPEAFLRWLIENPDQMTWPKNGRASFSPETMRWREKLMGRRDMAIEPVDQHTKLREAGRMEAQLRAMAELSRCGSAGSNNKWWAFEGRTSVDCYLGTDRLRIYVEGKRTDILSPSTDWYPKRNQLIRNLESARHDSGQTPFACLVIAEEKTEQIPASVLQDSLPHLKEQERGQLFRHFLGIITWREACEATGVNYGDLPATVSAP